MNIDIPDMALVLLIGSSGSGKSTFAAKHFLPTEVVSSDHSRGVVCDDETSMAATADSFELVRASIQEVAPDTVVAPYLTVGGTDTKHYVALAENSYRFKALRAGPDDLERIHGVNERVAVADYEDYIDFYVALLRRATGR